jgi:single-stranded-DNA-specific exonuclease
MQLLERPVNAELIDQFVTHGIHPVLARLWTSRGIEQVEDLSLETRHLIPSTALKGCSEAAQFLLSSIQSQKNY